MMRSARSGALLLISFLLAACGGGDGPTSSTKGTLEVAVSGLPAGTSAPVTVSGPGGFSRTLTASATLDGLTPGTYTVAAAQVGTGPAGFAVEQPSQSATVGAGAHATVQVAYHTLAASLSVTVAGVPASASSTITIVGPGGFSRSVASGAVLFGLAPGRYTVIAGGAATADSTYQGRPYRQTVDVAADGAVSAPVQYAPVGPASLDVSIDGMYVTQAIQRYDNSIPLSQGRDAYVRVFARASIANTASVSVRVRFYQNGTLVRTDTIPAPGVGSSVPVPAGEAAQSGGWALPVPGSLIQPGLSIVADVDPENALREASEANQSFPVSGTPQAQQVLSVPTLSVSFLPVHHTGTGVTGRIDASNLADYVATIKKIYPFATYDVSLHAVYNTDVAPVAADGGNWDTLLDEMLALRTAEGTGRYYFGVVRPDYNGGVAGLGFIGAPAALGWDAFNVGPITAHEMGHNFNRRHSPCGMPGGVDIEYPYSSGNIGVYGTDVQDGTVKPPTISDIMGYCNTQWISDYTYEGVLSFVRRPPGTNPGEPSPRQSLLVWGRMGPAGMVLEPAFALTTRPSLPARAGAYTVEGLDASGARLFSVSFEGEEVADVPDQRQFAFAVPVTDDQLARLATLRLAGGGRAAVQRSTVGGPSLSRSATGAGPTPLLRRQAGGRVALTWDAAQAPMVMVRDPRTGQVVSFARGGAALLQTAAGELDLVLSDGVRSTTRRVAVQAGP
ncbi:MAG: hypothetical protein JWM27_5011 [Gemmatimonadetes bacterium]|nr:hypothetical protein [Gemmatimonadota bacterium]